MAFARDDLRLYLVADGAGGQDAGDVAAKLAVCSIANYLEATAKKASAEPEVDGFGLARDARRLSAAFHKAHADVLEIASRGGPYRGMGTTATALLFSGSSPWVHLAHVGHSRCYRLRQHLLEQLTRDDSLLQDVLESHPAIDDALLGRCPRTAVTRALGMPGPFRVAVQSLAVRPGDRYLLCSDGLSGQVSEREIERHLRRGAGPSETVRALLAKANDQGGRDNIAALVVDCSLDALGHTPALPLREPMAPEPTEPEMVLFGIDKGALGQPRLVVVPKNQIEPDWVEALNRVLQPRK